MSIHQDSAVVGSKSSNASTILTLVAASVPPVAELVLEELAQRATPNTDNLLAAQRLASTA